MLWIAIVVFTELLSRPKGGATALVSILVISSPALAAPVECESRGARPPWIDDAPRGYAFEYFVGSAETTSGEIDAVKLALGNAVGEIGRRGLITVSSEQHQTQELVESAASSTRSAASDGDMLRTRLIEEVNVRGHSTQIRGLSRVESFTEECRDGRTRAHVLVRLPSRAPIEPPSFGHWMSRSLVPSWAQFEKGYTFRAWAILAVEAVAIPAAAVTGVLASSARSDAALARTQADRDFFDDRADALRTAALVTSAVALSVYAYNVIDGLVAVEWNTRE